MKFVEAKCPICAKRIQIPSDFEKPHCVYCGAQFLKDAALAYAGLADVKAKDKTSNQSDFVVVGGMLVHYRGSNADVRVPKEITCIGANAFESNRNIVSVTMPDTVTSIGRNAFSDCSSLKSIRLSESIVTIEASAFKNCSSLKEVRLPRTTKKLGEWCFANCSSMNVIYIPAKTSCDGYVLKNNPAKRVSI